MTDGPIAIMHHAVTVSARQLTPASPVVNVLNDQPEELPTSSFTLPAPHEDVVVKGDIVVLKLVGGVTPAAFTVSHL
jgi:hypothetical protein